MLDTKIPQYLSTFQYIPWTMLAPKILQGHKNDNKCIQRKLLILSLYYLGDLLVQINSFSWRGFGAAVRLLGQLQEVADWQISFKYKPLNLGTWQCRILLFAVCKIKIIYHLSWSKARGSSILISVLFLAGWWGKRQLCEQIH